VIFSETVVGVDESVQQLRSVVAELLTVTYQMLNSNPHSPNLHLTIPVQLQQLMMGPQRGNIGQGTQLLLPDPPSHSVTAAASTLAIGATGASTSPLAAPMFAPSMSVPAISSYRADPDDSASIRTTGSIVSMRSVRTMSNGFIEALNSSRVYKLVQRRRPTTNSNPGNSDASSIFSVSTGSTRLGRWSALSNLSLGDLAISEISVLELPLLISDIWDPCPYQLEQSAPPTFAVKKKRSLLRLNVISSSRGQIHSAIEGNNELVARALLTLGADIIHEVNLSGWTPLLHAAVRCRESICQLLLKNGAGLSAGSTRSGVMELASIRPSIERAVESSEKNVMTLQVLLLQAIMKTEELGAGQCPESLHTRSEY